MMRVWVTGGTGFVGGNIVHQALRAGHQAAAAYGSYRPSGDEPYQLRAVDMLDRAGMAAGVAEFEADLVVHCAILNNHRAMYENRRAGWEAYVEATRIAWEAAEAAGAGFVLVSTDWVFDGTQAGADEETPPNPINIYGVLKMASEMVTLERGGAVARVSGVNGVHRARPAAPRAQDPGFGYFVSSMVDALRRGDRFTVWEGDDINMAATPSLASECGDLILEIGARRLDGVFHCCGADGAGRMELARLACDAFDLDPDLLDSGPPDPRFMPPGPVPYDTTITCPRTSELLERRPTPLRSLLEQFRGEYEAVS